MAITALPDDLVAFSLEVDHAKSESDRPVFFFRYPTGKESRATNKLFSEAVAAAQPGSAQAIEEAAVILNKLLKSSIVEWRNLVFRGASVPSLSVDLDEVLTDSEVWELATAALRAPRLGEADRKKSVSQRPSAAESSVLPAPSAIA